MARLVPIMKDVLTRVTSQVEPFGFRQEILHLPNHRPRGSDSWIFGVDVALFLNPVVTSFLR